MMDSKFPLSAGMLISLIFLSWISVVACNNSTATPPPATPSASLSSSVGASSTTSSSSISSSMPSNSGSNYPATNAAYTISDATINNNLTALYSTAVGLVTMLKSILDSANNSGSSAFALKPSPLDPNAINAVTSSTGNLLVKSNANNTSNLSSNLSAMMNNSANSSVGLAFSNVNDTPNPTAESSTLKTSIAVNTASTIAIQSTILPVTASPIRYYTTTGVNLTTSSMTNYTTAGVNITSISPTTPSTVSVLKPVLQSANLTVTSVLNNDNSNSTTNLNSTDPAAAVTSNSVNMTVTSTSPTTFASTNNSASANQSNSATSVVTSSAASALNVSPAVVKQVQSASSTKANKPSTHRNSSSSMFSYSKSPSRYSSSVAGVKATMSVTNPTIPSTLSFATGNQSVDSSATSTNGLTSTVPVSSATPPALLSSSTSKVSVSSTVGLSSSSLSVGVANATTAPATKPPTMLKSNCSSLIDTTILLPEKAALNMSSNPIQFAAYCNKTLMAIHALNGTCSQNKDDDGLRSLATLSTLMADLCSNTSIFFQAMTANGTKCIHAVENVTLKQCTLSMKHPYSYPSEILIKEMPTASCKVFSDAINCITNDTSVKTACSPDQTKSIQMLMNSSIQAQCPAKISSSTVNPATAPTPAPAAPTPSPSRNSAVPQQTSAVLLYVPLIMLSLIL